MASQITSLAIVYSTVYLDADQRKHQSCASLAFVRWIPGDGKFPAQRDSDVENVSIWWRHPDVHVLYMGAVCRSRRNTEMLSQALIRVYIPRGKSPRRGLTDPNEINQESCGLFYLHSLSWDPWDSNHIHIFCRMLLIIHILSVLGVNLASSIRTEFTDAYMRH